MSGRTVIISLLLTALLCAPLVLYQTGFSSERDPAVTAECLDCHDDLAPGLAGTSHQLNAEGKGVAVGCTDCHFNYEAHLDDSDVFDGVALGGLNLREQSQICSQCHFGPHQQGTLELSVHDNCTTCHKVHDNPHPGLLLEKNETELCLQCHESVRGDFVLPFRHPVDDGVMKCSDCHMNQSDRSGQSVPARSEQACFQCHNEFIGPFPFEHQATVDYSAQEGGCLTCHAAHGSYLPRMLNRPYEAPNYSLCTQCHLVPLHQYNTFHGSQWAGQACADCHVDVHGSYNNRFLLTPALEADGCFAVGCHGR